MVSYVFDFLAVFSILAFVIFIVAWVLKKVLHKHFWRFLTIWTVLLAFVAIPVFSVLAETTMTPEQRVEQEKEDKDDAASERKAKAESVKVANSIKASSRNKSNSKLASNQLSEKKAAEKKAAEKKAAEKKAAKKRAAEKKVAKKKAKVSSGIKYKKVSLATFATNPEKYAGENIETSGHVTYIQNNPDDKNVYYVIILPRDRYSSSGYSYGSVVEVNIDSMQKTPIHDGDDITVQGGAMTSMLELNGRILKSDIVVDNVTVH